MALKNMPGRSNAQVRGDRSYGLLIPSIGESLGSIRLVNEALRQGVNVYVSNNPLPGSDSGAFVIPTIVHIADGVLIASKDWARESLRSWAAQYEVQGENYIEGTIYERVLQLKSPKIALYCGEGTHSSWVNVSRVLRKFGFGEADLVRERDIRVEALSEYDVVVFPGGNAIDMLLAIGRDGCKAVQDYVELGGSYLGICAGAWCATPSQYYMPIVDCEVTNLPSWDLGKGWINFESYNDRHPIMFGMKGKFKAFYAGGPFFGKVRNGEIVAKCAGIGSDFNLYAPVEDVRDAIGQGMVVCATKGQGRVVLFSFHPEYPKSPLTFRLLANALYHLTAREVTLSLPPTRNFLEDKIAQISLHAKGLRMKFLALEKDGKRVLRRLDDLETLLTELDDKAHQLDGLFESFLTISAQSETPDMEIRESVAKLNKLTSCIPELLEVLAKLQQQLSYVKEVRLEIVRRERELGFLRDTNAKRLIRRKLRSEKSFLNDDCIHGIIIHELSRYVLPTMTQILKSTTARSTTPGLSDGTIENGSGRGQGRPRRSI